MEKTKALDRLVNCSERSLFCASVILLLLTTPIAAADSATLRSLGGRLSRNAAGEIIGVDLSNSWLTDADLETLARLPQLETINLSYTKITDAGLEHLAPLKNVKVLDLYYAEAVTDLGIAHLKHWRNLEHLNVRGTKVTSTLFEHISKMTRLKFLDVGHSRVNDDLFEVLDSLPRLEHLSFGGNKMSGAALPLLKSYPALKELSVSGQQRTDSGLWSVAITDFNIGHIAQLSHLEVLDLGETRTSPTAVFRELARLENLHTLDLRGTRVTGKGLASANCAAEPATPQALEGQRHRRFGRPHVSEDGSAGSPRDPGNERDGCRPRAAHRQARLEAIVRRWPQSHDRAARGTPPRHAHLPNKLVAEARDRISRHRAPLRQLSASGFGCRGLIGDGTPCPCIPLLANAEGRPDDQRVARGRVNTTRARPQPAAPAILASRTGPLTTSPPPSRLQPNANEPVASSSWHRSVQTSQAAKRKAPSQARQPCEAMAPTASRATKSGDLRPRPML